MALTLLILVPQMTSVMDYEIKDKKCLKESSHSYSAFVVSTMIEVIVSNFVSIVHIFKIRKYIKTSQKNVQRVDQKILKRNKTALKTISLLTGIYFLLYLPARIFAIPVGFLFTQENKLIGRNMVVFYSFLQILQFYIYINHVVNIFVYMYTMKDFRKFVMQLLIFGNLYKRKHANIPANNTTERNKESAV